MPDGAVAVVAKAVAVSTDEAADLLMAWSKELRGTVAAKGSTRVAGLGTFRLEGTELTFEPEEALLRESGVLQRGLEPRKVLGATHRAAINRQKEARAARETTAPKKSQKAAPAKPVARRPVRPRLPWIAAGALVLAVAVWFFVISPGGSADSTEHSNPAGTETVAGDLAAEASESNSELLGTGDEGPIPDETTGIDSPAATAPPSDVQDPEPDAFDPHAGGYTLVVASFDNRESAERVMNQMQTLVAETATPVGIMRSQDGVWHRVSVGQVPTIDDALGLKEMLTMLPHDAWVLRITADS